MDRVQLLLGLQVALLGMVTPNMRNISCEAESGVIRLRTFFDGEVTAEDEERMEEVASELISHFPNADIVSECIRLDPPDRSFKHLKYVAYARYEGQH